MNVSIFEADHTNVSRAIELMRLAFEEQRRFVDPEPGIFRKDNFKTLTSEVRKKEKRLVVALQRQRLLGCVLCNPNQETESDFYFGRLAVHPRYRGNGIAAQLLDEVESIARSEKFTGVTCYVRIALRQNIQFFESKGYEIYDSGTHSGYDEPTFYKMRKKL
ncbi:MAG: GNAT family N-acetyltransferase [Chloroflexota bacterium]